MGEGFDFGKVPEFYSEASLVNKASLGNSVFFLDFYFTLEYS